MQFPFEALDGGAIVVSRPLRRCAVPGGELARIAPAPNPLIAACSQMAKDGARENLIWITLFLSALAVLVLSLAS